MNKDKSIVDKVIELTNSNQIQWRNYKEQKPKRTLDSLNFARVKVATKYPKRVMPLVGGYNKLQSYYAFNDKLVLVLTKGKMNDQLLLIAGDVSPIQGTYLAKNKYKKRQLDARLTVFTDEELEGKLTELHNSIHKIPDRKIISDSDVLEKLHENLNG